MLKHDKLQRPPDFLTTTKKGAFGARPPPPLCESPSWKVAPLSFFLRLTWQDAPKQLQKNALLYFTVAPLKTAFAGPSGVGGDPQNKI